MIRADFQSPIPLRRRRLRIDDEDEEVAWQPNSPSAEALDDWPPPLEPETPKKMHNASTQTPPRSHTLTPSPSRAWTDDEDDVMIIDPPLAKGSTHAKPDRKRFKPERSHALYPDSSDSEMSDAGFSGVTSTSTTSTSSSSTSSSSLNARTSSIQITPAVVSTSSFTSHWSLGSAQPMLLDRCSLTAVQIPHVHRIYTQLLTAYPVHIDLSKMGAGKTRSTQSVALLLGLSVLVICPKTVDAWVKEAVVTGVKLEKQVGYALLRSVKGIKNPKHGLLHREEVDVKSGGRARAKTYAEFTVSDKFKEMVRQGVLVVFDECQAGKNETDQTRAMRTLVNYITDLGIAGTKSKVMMVSGSMFDKKQSAIIMCQTMGLLPIDLKDAAKAFYSSRLLALCRSHHECDRGVKVPLSKFMSDLSITGLHRRGDLEEAVYTLFTDYALNIISSALPSPVLTVKFDAKCGFYKMNEEDEAVLKRAVTAMRRAAAQMLSSGRGEALQGLSALTNAIQEAHLSKVGLVSRLVCAELEKNPNCQVIVFGSYYDSIDAIAAWIPSRFGTVLKLTGRIASSKERQQILNDFQSGKNRVMICNTRVGGTGLNCQDTVGTRPRITFILPTHDATSTYQAMYRTYRQGAQSDVKVRFVFGDSKVKRPNGEESTEEGILKNLNAKSTVWRDLMKVQAAEGQFFLDLPHCKE